jgi:hypothetical protein
MEALMFKWYKRIKRRLNEIEDAIWDSSPLLYRECRIRKALDRISKMEKLLVIEEWEYVTPAIGPVRASRFKYEGDIKRLLHYTKELEWRIRKLENNEEDNMKSS